MFNKVFKMFVVKKALNKPYNRSLFLQRIRNKIPPVAETKVIELYDQAAFHFNLGRNRKTLLGNYRWFNNQHTISVNDDLNLYSFLITLIHEIAHQHARITCPNLREPHGVEWKEVFKNLMQRFLSPDIFPEDVLSALTLHMRNPAASSTNDTRLVKALRQYDPDAQNTLLLQDVPNGQRFLFNGRAFIKIENRRNRSLVEEASSRRPFTISKAAKVLIPETSVQSDNTTEVTFVEQPVSHIPDGSLFEFKSERYKKIKNQRSRVLIQHMNTRQLLLLQSHVPVIPRYEG